jgi:putative sigma-54 modulation protein
MNKNIKATNIEITPAISDYIDKRFSAFDRFIQGEVESALCEVEVGKTTRHHKSGDYFRAEVNLRFSGRNFYAVSEKDDLYAAIDEVKDEIVQQITTHKDKSQTLYRRGALQVKNILKGLGDFRNKFKK